MSASPTPVVVSDNPTLAGLVGQAGDVEVLPAVARRVLAMLGDESTTARKLEEVIERDAAIAGRVLKVANSAYYGLRCEVRSIQHAAALLGFSAIRSLIVAASAKSMYKRFGLVEKLLWDHAVGVASASRVLYQETKAGNRDDVFLGGLMHDVGKLVMNNETPNLYAEVMRLTSSEGLSDIEAEGQVYGYTHDMVGAEVARKWGLPTSLVNVIARHHDWCDGSGPVVDGDAAGSVAIVTLADRMCELLGIGHREATADMELASLRSANHLGLGEERLKELEAEVMEAFRSERALFE